MSHPLIPSSLVLTVILAIFCAPVQGQDGSLPKFAVDLYKNVAKTLGDGKNVAISPFSADTALSMTFVGAAGITKSELGTTLGIGQQGTVTNFAQKFKSINAASQSYTLQSANGLFLEQTYDILPSFRNTVVNDFAANISSVDFLHKAEAARKQINAFVESKTNNKIHDLFTSGSLNANNRLVLVNAVYFKADWEKVFQASKTLPNQSFTLANGENKSTPLMHLESRFSYTESADLDGAQVLELKYKNGDVSMVVILPKKESGISRLEASLTPAALNAALDQLAQSKVDVFLPKFKVNTGYDLVSELQAMGIRTAFGNAADFSGISRKRDLLISAVVQKVFVEVNEKGTEAAAATGLYMTKASVMIQIPRPPTFRADRPFLYLIRHNQTKSILFMGRVSDPTVET